MMHFLQTSILHNNLSETAEHCIIHTLICENTAIFSHYLGDTDMLREWYHIEYKSSRSTPSGRTIESQERKLFLRYLRIFDVHVSVPVVFSEYMNAVL